MTHVMTCPANFNSIIALTHSTPISIREGLFISIPCSFWISNSLLKTPYFKRTIGKNIQEDTFFFHRFFLFSTECSRFGWLIFELIPAWSVIVDSGLKYSRHLYPCFSGHALILDNLSDMSTFY